MRMSQMATLSRGRRRVEESIWACAVVRGSDVLCVYA